MRVCEQDIERSMSIPRTGASLAGGSSQNAIAVMDRRAHLRGCLARTLNRDGGAFAPAKGPDASERHAEPEECQVIGAQHQRLRIASYLTRQTGNETDDPSQSLASAMTSFLKGDTRQVGRAPGSPELQTEARPLSAHAQWPASMG